MKVCTRCYGSKDLSEFHKRSDARDGLNPQCKSCRSEYSLKHYARPATKLRAREVRLRYMYGITVEEYEERLAQQDGKCAICRTDKPGNGMTTFAVDHCHWSGAVRGVLCHPCNLSLGNMNDEPARFLAAAEYLNQSFAAQAA